MALRSDLGVGKLRHLDVRLLWIQEHLREKAFVLSKVASADNISDLGTKSVSRAVLEKLLPMAGLVKLGGADVDLDTWTAADFGKRLGEMMAIDAVKAVIKTVGANPWKAHAATIGMVMAFMGTAKAERADEVGSECALQIPIWFVLLMLAILGMSLAFALGLFVGRRLVACSAPELISADMTDGDTQTVILPVPRIGRVFVSNWGRKFHTRRDCPGLNHARKDSDGLPMVNEKETCMWCEIA